MRRRFTRVTGEEDAGQRLDVLAAAWLQSALGRAVSKSVVRRLIMAGAIRLDGRPARQPGRAIEAGARLEALVDEGRIPQGPAEVVPRLDVLYEDATLIAVAKPAGLPVHPTADPARPDLFTAVRALLGSSGGAAGHYLGVHQRLDVGTSGVVLYTKSPSANAGLARQFEEHAIEKTYHALALKAAEDGAGRKCEPGAEWQVSNLLAQVGKGKASRVRSVADGGARAETAFRILDCPGPALLIEARPTTGRKHQIRAHLAEGGTPILGDVRYGGADAVGVLAVTRPMLHARALALRHPVTGEPLRIECGYPEDFERLLSALRRSRADRR